MKLLLKVVLRTISLIAPLEVARSEPGLPKLGFVFLSVLISVFIAERVSSLSIHLFSVEESHVGI